MHGGKSVSIIITIKSVAFGLNGLTLFVETPWFDASIGRHGADLLVHGR